MALYINPESTLHADALWVVYDLEFVGQRNQFEHARVWDVGAVGLEGESFQGTCVPCTPIPPPIDPKYVAITKPWLRKQPHFYTRKSDCLAKFIEFLLCASTSRGKSKIVLVAHGNFHSDKIVLEAECARLGLALPDNVYFFDSLPMFRRLLPGIVSYRLNTIAKALLRTSEALHHRALDDARLLQRCLAAVGQSRWVGCAYRAGCVPLKALPGVGSATERKLVEKHGISSVYDLCCRIVALRATTPKTCRSLLVGMYGLSWRTSKVLTRALLPQVPRVPLGSTAVVPQTEK